jgi:hypothetical protein
MRLAGGRDSGCVTSAIAATLAENALNSPQLAALSDDRPPETVSRYEIALVYRSFRKALAAATGSQPSSPLSSGRGASATL